MVHAKVKPQPPGVKAVLFFDGHPSHTTKKSLALANRLFEPLRNVPHSCNFNSIEKLWSVAKNNLMKILLL